VLAGTIDALEQHTVYLSGFHVNTVSYSISSRTGWVRIEISQLNVSTEVEGEIVTATSNNKRVLLFVCLWRILKFCGNDLLKTVSSLLFEVVSPHGHENSLCGETNPTSVAALTAENTRPQSETWRKGGVSGLVSPHEPMWWYTWWVILGTTSNITEVFLHGVNTCCGHAGELGLAVRCRIIPLFGHLTTTWRDAPWY
jgi:hypothetical protein